MLKEISMGRKVSLLIALIIGVPIAGLANFEKSDDDLLKRPIDGSKLVAESFDEAISELATVYKVRICLEGRVGSKAPDANAAKVKEQISMFRGPLESFLDYVVQLDPGYAWAYRDGIINIFPTPQRDPKLTDILDTRVKEFTLRKMTGVMGAGDALCDTPEVTAKLKLLRLTPLHFYKGHELDRPPVPKPLVKVKDKTVREILNALLLHTDGVMWTISRWGPEKNVLTITLR